jgi:hypothetical protein
VRINKEFVETVAFLCEAKLVHGRTIHKPGGTAFFVRVPDEGNSGHEWTYIVTARHNLSEIVGQDIYVRVNHASDESKLGYKDFRTSKADWFQHDSADVAAALFIADDEVMLSLRSIPLVPTTEGYGRIANYLNQRYPKGVPVSLGEDLFFPGLFIQSAGKNRNLPIVRFGNISRMPTEEPILLETKGYGKEEIRAYLAEFHSWGGHSGSPVFWRYVANISEEFVINNQKRTVMVSRHFVAAFLGLVTGHFDIPTKTKRGGEQEDLMTKVNSGMAIVTPAENVRELLMRSDLAEDRRLRAIAHSEDQPTATADFADMDDDSATLTKPQYRAMVPMTTRAQFYKDLTKATRKRDKK